MADPDGNVSERTTGPMAGWCPGTPNHAFLRSSDRRTQFGRPKICWISDSCLSYFSSRFFDGPDDRATRSCTEEPPAGTTSTPGRDACPLAECRRRCTAQSHARGASGEMVPSQRNSSSGAWLCATAAANASNGLILGVAATPILTRPDSRCAIVACSLLLHS